MLALPGVLPDMEGAGPLLELHRARAERMLNGVRALVLLLLLMAALAYAPTLPHALNLLNVFVLALTLAWTFAQWVLFSRSELLPGWLSVVNPVVDITAVTVLMGGYGLTQSASLALRSPLLLAYAAILASRPITSSTRKAAAMAVLVVVEYGALVAFLVVSGRTAGVVDPIGASAGAGISPLDEGAKLLLLAVAGGISTYATAWYERLLVSHELQARDRLNLESRLTLAQLQALKHQLQPHFLFNTLNTITALIGTDARAAEGVVTRLSELLRVSLYDSADHEVSLARELEVLQLYVDIQHIRFPDRLHVELRASHEARLALVPNLVLQPLVENAIRHGIAPRAAGGRVLVLAERDGELLRIRVSDDGVGARADRLPLREGVGLGNTRERLRHLYGARHEFHVGPDQHGGFVVSIAIPYRTPSAASAAPVLAEAIG
jgi:two-component sensor histidine kinase